MAALVLGGCPPAPAPVDDDDDDATGDDDDATDDDDDATGDDDDATNPWEPLTEALESTDLEDFTLLIGTPEGIEFVWEAGDSSTDRIYPIASASKWLTSVTALRLVEEGTLALDDNPQDHLPWWTGDGADARSAVTLEQLLSFTSGLSGDVSSVPCVEDGQSTLDACAQAIYADFFAYEPGTTFVYGPAHMQVAAAMASETTGRRWNRLFRQQIGDDLGMASQTAFALPSLDNPRAAGGATANAQDYASFLIALSSGELLSPESLEVMAADHTGAGVVLEEVPATASDGRSWHYALGCWRECEGEVWTAACDEPGVLSSPGAFGFYPWWDQRRGFWGVLATQFVPGDGGGAERTVPLGQAWAELAAAALEAR